MITHITITHTHTYYCYLTCCCYLQGNDVLFTKINTQLIVIFSNNEVNDKMRRLYAREHLYIYTQYTYNYCDECIVGLGYYYSGSCSTNSRTGPGCKLLKACVAKFCV